MNCLNISAATNANTAAIATDINMKPTKIIISLLLLYEFCRRQSIKTGIPDKNAAIEAIIAETRATDNVSHLLEPSFKISHVSLFLLLPSYDVPGLKSGY